MGHSRFLIFILGFFIVEQSFAATKKAATNEQPTLSDNPSPVFILEDTPEDPVFGAQFQAAQEAETKKALESVYNDSCAKDPEQVFCTTLQTSISEVDKLQKNQEALFQSQLKLIPKVPQTKKGTSILSCNLDKAAPGPYDPLKVINLRFIIPKVNTPNSPGGFTLEHDGLGDSANNYVNYLNEFVENKNYLTTVNTQQNHVTPAPSVLPIGFRFRVASTYQAVIPVAEINKYFYFTTNVGTTGGTWNSPSQNPYYILNSSAVNVAFQDQRGATVNERGLPLLTNSSPTLDPQGNWILSVFPNLTVGGIGYVNALAPSTTATMVIGNEWLRHSLRQRYWNQSTTSNNPFMGPFGAGYSGGLFMHEMGHLLGLSHTWDNSNHVNGVGYLSCDDIAQWKSSPWCGNASTTQNNVMDYNCSHNAWTPCQLKIAHYNLQNALKKVLYLPVESDHEYDTVIPANAVAVWDSPHDMVGDLILEAGAKLTVRCGATLPNNGKIIKGAGASIINENFIVKRPKVDLETLDPENVSDPLPLEGGDDNTTNVDDGYDPMPDQQTKDNNLND